MMRTISTELKKLSNDINLLLTLYIEVHDSVFKFNLRHIIPLPFIFKAIDYPILHRQIIALCGQMRDNERKINELQHSIASNPIPDSEMNFLNNISEYVSALIETLLRFENMLNELRKKMEDPTSYKYSLYKNQLKNYKEAVKVYLALGDKMNEFYYEIHS